MIALHQMRCLTLKLLLLCWHLLLFATCTIVHCWLLPPEPSFQIARLHKNATNLPLTRASIKKVATRPFVFSANWWLLLNIEFFLLTAMQKRHCCTFLSRNYSWSNWLKIEIEKAVLQSSCYCSGTLSSCQFIKYLSNFFYGGHFS